MILTRNEEIKQWMMKNFKTIILTNSIMIIIGIFTYISIYNPSMLKFSSEEYVSRGGDYLTEGLFTYLIHYVNLFVFYLVNSIFAIRHFTQKNMKGVMVALIYIVLMLGISFWVDNASNQQEIQVEELQNSN